MADRIQYRRDTSENWQKANPILLEGEIGLETDTRNSKLGDGVHHWNDLDYALVTPIITQNLGWSDTLVVSQKVLTNELVSLRNSFLIDYGTAASKFGGAPAIDYGNASTDYSIT